MPLANGASLSEELELYRQSRNASDAIFEMSDENTPRSKVLWLYIEGRKRVSLKLDVVTATGLRPSLVKTTEQTYVPVLDLCPASDQTWYSLFKQWAAVPTIKTTPNPCCEHKPSTTITSPTPTNTCFLLSKWLLKNACPCDQLGTRYCVTCKAPFCLNCSERSIHQYHSTRLNRSPCTQLVIEKNEEYTLHPAELLKCEGCEKFTCSCCVKKYTQAAIIENVPNEWRDGDVIEGLEEAVGAQVVEYERQCKDKHFYVQFDRQVMLLGTQCIKLRDQHSKREMWIRPPHAARQVKHHCGLSIIHLVFKQGVPAIPFMELLTAILRACGLKPLDVKYALPSQSGVLVEAADTTARFVFLKLNHLMHEGICYYVSSEPWYHHGSRSHPPSIAPPIHEGLKFYMELNTWFEHGL